MLFATFSSIFSDPAFGQALLALIIAITGYILNHKTKQVHVLVNGKLADKMAQIAALEAHVTAQDARILVLEKAAAVAVVAIKEANGTVPDVVQSAVQSPTN